MPQRKAPQLLVPPPETGPRQGPIQIPYEDEDALTRFILGLVGQDEPGGGFAGLAGNVAPSLLGGLFKGVPKTAAPGPKPPSGSMPPLDFSRMGGMAEFAPTSVQGTPSRGSMGQLSESDLLALRKYLGSMK